MLATNLRRLTGGQDRAYGLLLISSLLGGLGAGTFHPQSTNFLTRAFPKAKGRAMGIHGWGGSIGNFLAPLVVAHLVSVFGWRQGVMLLAFFSPFSPPSWSRAARACHKPVSSPR